MIPWCNVMIVGPFLVPSKKLMFFCLKKMEFGQLRIFPLLYQCWLLSTNINIIKRINAYYCVYTSGSQSGRYRPPGVNWTIQGVDK